MRAFALQLALRGQLSKVNANNTVIMQPYNCKHLRDHHTHRARAQTSLSIDVTTHALILHRTTRACMHSACMFSAQRVIYARTSRTTRGHTARASCTRTLALCCLAKQQRAPRKKTCSLDRDVLAHVDAVALL